MNRFTITLTAGMLILLLTPPLGADDHRFTISLTGQLFISSDTAYRDLHGSSEFLPQLTLDHTLPKGLLIWADLSHCASEVALTELDDISRVTRLHGGIGLGYHLLNTPSLRLSLRSGLAIHQYREEALDLAQSTTRLGFRLGLCCDWFVARALFIRLTMAQSWVGHEIEGQNIALGGFQLGGGLGLRF